MKVAVASRDGKTVAGHMGKCAAWIVYTVTPSAADAAQLVVSELERVKLPRELVFHHFRGDAPHPLQDCAAVIGASAGDSFISKMQRRGIQARLTAEADPAKAVLDYVSDTLIPARPRPIGGLICKLRDALSRES